MRVAFVTGDVTVMGGAHGATIPLAKALRRSGHEVLALHPIRGRERAAEFEGVPVRFPSLVPHLLPRLVPTLRQRLRAAARPGHVAWPRRMADATGYDLAVSHALSRALAEFAPDVTYALHNVNVFRVMAAGRGAHGILTVDLSGFGIDPARGGMVDTFPLQRLIFERPWWEIHAAPTRFELGQYASVYRHLGLDEGKLLHLPRPVDDEVFRLVPPRREAFVPAEWRRALVYPVQVYPRKNLELALEVLARLQDDGPTGLLVSGRVWDAAYRERIEGAARRSGLADRLRFLGGVPTEQMRQLFAAADATIFPSHQETFGHGLLESLMCGAPVVGPSWLPPCAELLTDVQGAWLALKDADAYAAQVRDVLNRKHDRAAIADGARSRFGSGVLSRRFIARVEEMKAVRDEYHARLDAIDWRSLYRDEGDLKLDAGARS